MRYGIEIDQPEGRGPLVNINDCPVGAFFVIEQIVPAASASGSTEGLRAGDLCFREGSIHGGPATFANFSHPTIGVTICPLEHVYGTITGYVIRPPARIVLQVEE